MNRQPCPMLSRRMPKKKHGKLNSLSSLKDELENMDHSEFPTPSNVCIYKVPPDLRKMNGAAYTPTNVSIGPYHYGNKRLKSMEEVKLWFLFQFLKRNDTKSLDYYVDVLKDQEAKIRRCYSETIPMESDEFVRMVLTDACFIIEYFLLRRSREVDRWHSKLWSMDLRRDLILLENQLPYFVLKELFGRTFPNGYDGGIPFEFITFAYIYAGFRSQIIPDEKLLRKFTFEYFVQHHLPKLPDGTPQVHHLCDMLRIFYVPLDDQQLMKYNGTKWKPVYNASKLHDAGIKFEVNEDDEVISLLKLHYSNGVVKIPRIMVFDSTDTLLRNVVAFEQCHFRPYRSVTDYIILLGHLIRTGKDVEVLVEKGILQNFIGENDAVASITKKLGRQTVFTHHFNNDYISLFEETNKFCDRPYHKYKAIFKEQYWSTPWRIASFLGAILLLLLTLIQTIFSIIATYKN